MKNSSNFAEVVTPPYRILSDSECEQRTNLKKKQMLRMEAAGKFPRRIPLADRLTGYLESEVNQWIRERVEQRESAIAQRRSPNPLARKNRQELKKGRGVA